MVAFAEFFNNVKEANYGFGVIRDAIVSMYYSITENPDIAAIWNGMMGYIQDYFVIVCAVLAIGCLVVAFLGQKMMGFLRFVFFFIIGFVLGVHLLAPIIPAEVPIPAWVVGLVVAIVAAVLCRFLYYVLYAVAAGYSVYILCYHGFYIPDFDFVTKGNAIISLIVAAVIVVLAFVFRSYIERAGTAALGGWFATVLVANFVYDFAAWPVFGGMHWLGKVIVSCIIGIAGFVVQIVSRSRY